VVKPSFQRFVRDSKKCDVFSTDELNRLFVPDNFSSETFFLFFLVCLSAGMRLGEIRAFRAQQYVPEYKSVIIDGFLSHDSKTRNAFNKTGTEENPRFRVSLIPDKTADLLEKYITDNNRTGEEYVFFSSGKPIRQEFAEAEFARAIKRAEIPVENKKFTPHSLRYTFVTRTRRLFDANSVMMCSFLNSLMTAATALFT
jgi:integrase